jgi:uncharacterized membrane protein
MYKIIGADQKEYGPVSADEIRQWLAQGRANGQTPVQMVGDSGWKPLSLCPEFAAALAASPPPIAPLPPLPGGHTQLPADILQRDYDLDIGNCVDRGWQLVKNNFGAVVGGCALFILVQFAISGLGAIPLIGVLFSAVNFFIAGPLMGGLYFYLLKVIRGQSPAISEVFSGFGPRFLPMMLVYIVMMLIMLVLAIPGGILLAVGLIEMLHNHEVDPVGLLMVVGGFIVLIIPVMYIATCWMFALPLAMDKQLDFWAAMETSRKVVNKHWWKMFALLIVCGLINVLGVCACYIGIFVTIPIGFSASMYAYEDIFRQQSTTTL